LAAKYGSPACSQLRRDLVAIMNESDGTFFAGIEQAGLFVTAI
jgi:hypothetical protein